MYLSNLKIWNFRKFGTGKDFTAAELPHLNLPLNENVNVLIGENDSGKTAIIDAIKLVLKTHSYEYIKVEHEDFSGTSSRIRIELKLEGLADTEAMHFTEWLGWTGEGDKAIPYLLLILTVSRKGNRIEPYDVKAGVGDETTQLTAQAKEYLKVTYLKPLRDAKNELIEKKNSRLSQILLGDNSFKDKHKDHDLVKLFDKINTNLQKFFKGDSFSFEDKDGQMVKVLSQEGKKIKDKIDTYIKQFHSSQQESHFRVNTENNIRSVIEKITLALKDELNPGLGTLNRLFMAAELLHLNKPVEEWSGLRLGLVEEMEAHLHPQAQMQVIEALQQEKSIQLILTTHSPNLASKVKLHHLILCNKKQAQAFPLGELYTKLSDKKGDYEFLERFLDVTKANLFFAEGILLVEGWAEEIILPSLAKKIGYNLSSHKVSVVNVGNTSMLRYSKIFLRKAEPKMAIPVSVITDVDVREYQIVEKNAEKRDDVTIATEAEAKKNDLIKKYQEDPVKVFIALHWTLEYCLFKSKCLSSKFIESVKSVHSDTDWDTNFEATIARKLIDKSLDKTEIAYLLAQSIDALPSIAIDKDDTIAYLKDAITYACRHSNN